MNVTKTGTYLRLVVTMTVWGGTWVAARFAVQSVLLTQHPTKILKEVCA